MRARTKIDRRKVARVSRPRRRIERIEMYENEVREIIRSTQRKPTRE